MLCSAKVMARMGPSWLLLLLSTLLALQWTPRTGTPSSGVECANTDNNYHQWQDLDQLIQQTFPQSSGLVNSFDSSQFKSIYEAIRAHPELREFANLCESKGVKEIVGMDKTQLTVFAPVDRALAELLKRQRPANLAELAKQHIVQGFVAPDETANYPVQLSSYAALSPIYLNRQVRHAQGRPTATNYYVNNAKILATYLIQIDPDNYQTLHLIDLPLDYVYLNKRTQIRSPSSGSSSSSSMSSSSMGSNPSASSQVNSRYASVKRPLSLDEFTTKVEANEQAQAIKEFQDRFGDLSANEPQIDLYHVRSSPRNVQLVSKDQVNLERLVRFVRTQPKFRGKLYGLNESSAFNTYFLPVNSDELDNLLDAAAAAADDNHHQSLSTALETHIIPNQVLFTRQMSLGEPFETSLSSTSAKVHLNLAKTVTSAAGSLLSTPLLVQANCQPGQRSPEQPQSALKFGLTQTEVLVANIPLSNGVLHLIKRPLVLTDQVSLLDYLNDSDNQLSDVVQALGSRTSPASSQALPAPVKLNRFRELLARERQLLASFTQSSNSTVLAPSDEAFSRLRYDLRALIEGDESLVPAHWDDSYKQDLLERLVKRHVIAGRSLTSAELVHLASQPGPSSPLISSSGQLVSFKTETTKLATGGPQAEDNLLVECDSPRPAKLIQKDLVTSNGVLHVIDAVLGEDQETIHSLLRSLVLRQERLVGSSGYLAELSSLVESNLRQLSGTSSSQENRLGADQPNGDSSTRPHEHPEHLTVHQSPELDSIGKSIGQFLDELGDSKLQALATSVNVSFQLARLSSLAETHLDWNERFRQTDAKLTYFIPSDLAWLRLQQRQPELYKPLNYFLSSGADQVDVQPAPEMDPTSAAAPAKVATTTTTSTNLKSSESSHRLLQILERHLIPNRKVGERDLRRLEAIETAGATLRVVDAPQQQQQQPTLAMADSAPGAFAALHSILGGQMGAASQHQQANSLGKALRLNKVTANLVQANETSNGYLYIVDYVLVEPEDSTYLQQTSPSASSAILSSSMSSLLGGHNSALLEFIQNFVSPSSQALNLSVSSMLALIGTLSLAILVLFVVALVLVVRRHKQNKLLNNRHEQLESGMTSASSANSGSTSTTKSL